MHAVAPDYPNFLDTNDSQFKVTHTIMDTYFRQLRMEGVGAVVKHANVISKEEENALWEQGVLGNDTPNVYCVLFFYYNGKSLCLCRGKEHRTQVSQFVRLKDPDRYIE